MTENEIELRQADTDPAVAACFPVLSQLRPHLADVSAVVAQIGRQRQEGYRLLAGYEDVNDADRLAHDPTMGAVVDRGGLDRAAAVKYPP